LIVSFSDTIPTLATDSAPGLSPTQTEQELTLPRDLVDPYALNLTGGPPPQVAIQVDHHTAVRFER